MTSDNMAKAASKQKEKVSEDKSILKDLNPAQSKAVSFNDGPLLIIAGAGTGKTTLITRRIARLIAQGIKPDEILALTFTEKAAAEMEERVDILLPYGYYDLWISTFHAFCERILKQHALDIGISNDFKVYDNVQQWLLVRKNLEKFKLDYYKPLGNPTKFINALIKHFSKAKDEEISPEEYEAYAKKLKPTEELDEEEIKRIKEIAQAYAVYQQLLLDNNALDFGDLINYTLKLFRDRKKILNFYRDKFKFILVDEFQDTNFAQYELVKLLASPKNNLNVVGDDDQSIYKFRGASVSNILQFKKDYPTATEITLTENYRSTQNILDVAYNFIQLNNPERLEPKLNISKKLVAKREGKGNIEVLSGQTLSDEVDMVVKKILEIKKKNKESLWSDFAILVRANDQADVFISKLQALGLPYIFFANKGLYKKPIISDLITYMKLLLDYHESACLYKILNLETFKINQYDLVNIMHFGHKKTLSLYEALQQASEVQNIKKETLDTVKNLLTLLGEHGEMAAKKNVVEVFIKIVRDLKVANRIKEDTIENLANREILEQFYRKIEQFESENTDKSLRNFVEALNFEQEAGEEGRVNFDPNQGPESIKLMTIHSSKGLEFEHVFVVNMVHLRFPSIDRKEAIEIPQDLVKEILPEGDVHLQEERRLFYVAMTRAKSGLYFSYAYDYGGQRAKKPSQFLMDIGLIAKPEKSIELVRDAGAKTAVPTDPNIFLPTSFSFTQISDFWRCPMKYKYRHLLHLPLVGNHHLSFGNTIHITLEKFLNKYKVGLEMKQLDLFDGKKQQGLPTLADLLEIYEKNWVDEWYETKEQKYGFKERGIQILKSFYEEFEKAPVAPKYLEKSFRLKIGDFNFNGKIDRADLDEHGHLHIVDYKTGEGKLDKDKKDRYQLLIYQWAAEEFLREKVGSLRYWYLYDNTFSESSVGKPEELAEVKAVLLEAIESIRHAVSTNTFKELDRKIKHECEFEELE